MKTSSTSPYEGVFAPATEEVTAFDLPVTGHIPAELSGRYLRNGPNQMNLDDPQLHLFVGDGMVHGVRLRDGKAEWYRNRWVRSAHIAEALGEEVLPGASDNGRDIGANTHVVGLGNRTFAIMEGGSQPYELGYDIDTLGVCDFGGTLRGGFAAHPKLDPLTGELHAITYDIGGTTARYVVVSPAGLVVRSVDIPLAHGPMLHDMALTRNYVVVYDLPVAFSLDAAQSGKRLPLVWQEGRRGRIGLLPRNGTEVRWFDIDPCWVFHTLNGYDDGDKVVVDVVRYQRMFVDTEIRGNSLPTLDRWTLDTVTGTLAESRLDDRPQEFPAVSPARVTDAHRYGYTAVTGTLIRFVGPDADLEEVSEDSYTDGLLKQDLTQQTSELHAFGKGRFVSEPCFVPAADSRAEDDGYVLSYVFDPDRGASDLVILSGQDFTGVPVATIHLPARVPSGFHGSWLPDPS